jgi:ribosome-associated translation inhibitor RaiA
VRLHRAVGATPIIARAEGVDFRTALDAVERKLRRQLERSRRYTSQRRHLSA